MSSSGLVRGSLSYLGFVVLWGLMGLGARASTDDEPPNVTEPPAFAEFLVVPLRVHVLTAESTSAIDCRLTDDDIRRVVGKANGVWNKAGIHLGLESIVREPAANVERFEAIARLTKDDAPLGVYRILRPEDSRAFDGMHVYYVHELPVNGVYLGDRVAFVKETAALRPVEGGIDEPLPRVTSHEIGHAFGLPHRQARTNLLASGTTGTLLNRAEVDQAREGARKLPGTVTVAEVESQAAENEKLETEDSRDRAGRLRSWLSEIPGSTKPAQ